MGSSVTLFAHCFIVIHKNSLMHFNEMSFVTCDDKKEALIYIQNLGPKSKVEKVIALSEMGKTEEYELVVNGFKVDLVPKGGE